jgi:hypothetical protein
MERALIAALTAQYWQGEKPSTALQDAVTAYVATTAIHHLLEGSNFAAPRFFGGHVSFPLRSVLLSPPIGNPRTRVRAFDDPGRSLDRRLRGLQTIERLVGWPTMLEALSTIRAAGDDVSAASLGDALSQVTGADLRRLVAECLREDATFDYAVDRVASASSNGLVETTIALSRRGDGRFSLLDDNDHEASVPVLVRFADGSELRDVFDGAAPATTLVYTARAEASAVYVDPDVMLVVDVERANNAYVRNPPFSKLGARLGLHWLAWLQNAMLSYMALV